MVVASLRWLWHGEYCRCLSLLCKQPFPLTTGAILGSAAQYGSNGKWEGTPTWCIATLAILTVLPPHSYTTGQWLSLISQGCILPLPPVLMQPQQSSSYCPPGRTAEVSPEWFHGSRVSSFLLTSVFSHHQTSKQRYLLELML